MQLPFSNWKSEPVRFSVIERRNSWLRNSQTWSHAVGSRLWKLSIGMLLSFFSWQMERPKLRIVGSDTPINQVLCFKLGGEPAHDREIFKWPLYPQYAKMKFLWENLLLGTCYLTSKNVGQKVLLKKRPSYASASSERKYKRCNFTEISQVYLVYTICFWRVFLYEQLNPSRLRNDDSISAENESHNICITKSSEKL